MTLDEIITVLSQQPQLRERCRKALRQLGATSTPRSAETTGNSTVSDNGDLFAVPPPLPDSAVGRRERRNLRRKAQYWADRQAKLCVACRERPPASPTHSRCRPCADIQKRSADRRKQPNNS